MANPFTTLKAQGEEYVLEVNKCVAHAPCMDAEFRRKIRALSDDDFVSFMSQILFAITSCQRGNRYAVVLIPIIGQRMAHEIVEMFDLYKFVN